MKTSRLASSVTSHSLIIVREFDLMQGISESYRFLRRTWPLVTASLVLGLSQIERIVPETVHGCSWNNARLFTPEFVALSCGVVQ
jgi:hypothetical protein